MRETVKFSLAFIQVHATRRSSSTLQDLHYRGNFLCWTLSRVMNPTNSFAEATRRGFDNWSLKSAEDNNFIEDLEEFLKIMNHNQVDEEEFFKYLNFGMKMKSALSPLYPKEITLLMLSLMTRRTLWLRLSNLPTQEIIRKLYLKVVKCHLVCVSRGRHVTCLT